MPTEEVLVIEKSNEVAEQYPYASIDIIQRGAVGCSLLTNSKNNRQYFCEKATSNISYTAQKEGKKIIVTKICGISVRSCKDCSVCQEKTNPNPGQ